MTGYIGRTDGGRVVEELTPESLRALLLGAEQFVVVEEQRETTSGRVAQASRSGAEAWQVAVRNEAAECLRTSAANIDATFDILRSWAAGDGWWREAFDWEPLDRLPRH